MKYKTAVHLHLHYADLVEQVCGYLRNIPFPFDLIVTLTDEMASDRVRAVVMDILPDAGLHIRIVENKGRDVKPFYTDIRDLVLQYEIICHIHGKKSAFNQGATDGWLEYLLDHLMGNSRRVEQIMDRFRKDPSAGLIYPPTYYKLPYWANTWLSNRGWAGRLQKALGIGELPQGYFSYPIGNMFWARVKSLQPLLGLELQSSDYPAEPCMNDGEIMHALERMVTVASRAKGFNNYIIRGDELVDDRFGIDFSAYYGRSIRELKDVISSPSIKLVCFDIFDTIIFRRLPDATDIFRLMEPTVTRMKGRVSSFRTARIEADGWARARLKPGTDVTLAMIYDRIRDVLDLNDDETRTLMALELSLEKRYMVARQPVCEAMRFAYEQGKRVILASDMYLDRAFVEDWLQELGIGHYHELYISSDTGRRKDNRTLFPYILQQEGISASEMIHIGDNEQSDLQVPGDLGIKVFHVMRATTLFAHTHLGMAGIMAELERAGLPTRIAFGLCLVRLFEEPFPRERSLVAGDLRKFGYLYFGPMVLGFVKWLADRGRTDGIETLYFLARDGEILLKVYHLLEGTLADGAPAAEYLEISRRSLGVPFLKGRSQLDKLLHPEYFGGRLQDLLSIRLGFDLAEHEEVDVKKFGFTTIGDLVHIPADLARIQPLAYHIHESYPEHFNQEQVMANGYLESKGLFKPGTKAVVDIGYSGTMQRILNDISADGAVDGYYMVLYSVINSWAGLRGVQARGLFGHLIDPYLKSLSVDKYSPFYEMVFSSTAGPVAQYAYLGEGQYEPVYAPVSELERGKLEKLPAIHEGIMEYCRDFLAVTGDPSLIEWENHFFLLQPFQHFLEHPFQQDVAMLAGYSLDDDYCGNGVLYWASPEYGGESLWKKYVPQAAVWSGREPGAGEGLAGGPAIEGLGGFANRREYEIFSWYQVEYEVLPRWYKRIGQVFHILSGRKRVRIVLEDVQRKAGFHSKADEIQAWYNKEYEVLPRWYKRFGHFLRSLLGRDRKLKTQTIQ